MIMHQIMLVLKGKEYGVSNQEKKDKKRYKIKETFDFVDWDRVNNLTNEEVDIVHDLLKDIK